MSDEELIDALARAIATSMFSGVLPSPANVVDYRTEAVAALAVIAPELKALRAENARLRDALKNARAAALKEGAEIAFAYNGMPRSEIAQAFARAAMGESDD